MRKPKTEPKTETPIELNLAAWLTDERFDRYFGYGFRTKAAVLALIVEGRPGFISRAARERGVTRQAVSKQVGRARKIFGTTQPAS
jgi:hypothetical protein